MGYQIDERTLRHEEESHAEGSATSYSGVIWLVVILVVIGMARGAARQTIRQAAREHYAQQLKQREESERLFEELVRQSEERNLQQVEAGE